MPIIEVEIIGMLRQLNALSRRHKNPPDMTQSEDMNGFPPPPPPEGYPHEHGRGRLMGLLNDEGEMNQCGIASRLGIRPQSLSELIVKMESDGLISRRQSDEDKRSIIVSLTDKGRARVENFRSAHRQNAVDFLSPLSDNEKKELADMLKRLIEAKK